MTTIYTLDQKTPYGGAIATLVAAADVTLDNISVGHEYMGASYSPVSRRIYFSACAVIDDGVGDVFNMKVNHTGFVLWSFDAGQINPLASYDADFYKNFHLCYLDIDSFAVTMVDVWDSTSAIPNGINGSDGTWRRMFQASVGLHPTQQFKIVDPLTAGAEKVWVHTTGPECQVYLLDEAEGFKNRLSPLTIAGSGHMELLGLTPDWLLVMSSTTVARNNGSLYTVPRVTTADEITADELLGYFFEAQPAWMNTAYWRSVVAQDGSLYIFGSTRTGAKDYRLYRYDPPAAVGAWTGAPQAGGTFTDITPWAAGTGPNTNCAAWAFDTRTGGIGTNTNYLQRWSLNSAWKLPATGELILLSQLTPQNTTNLGTNHDPANYRLDCTYYDIAGVAFDYHEGFVIGFMKADWTPAAGVGDAAYAVQWYREVDPFREFSDFDYGDDYTRRWFSFTVQPVAGGVFVWDATGAANLTVLAKYHFVSGAAPALEHFEIDASWLTDRAAYAAAIGNNNVVEKSVQIDNEWVSNGEYYQRESGILDAGATTVFWFGGQNGQTKSIDPTFPTYTGQDGPAPASAFVRLAFGPDAPVASRRPTKVGINYFKPPPWA